MYCNRRYILGRELQGILLYGCSKLATPLQVGCWGFASPWHSDFIAIVKRIRNEIVTTLVWPVRPGSDVLSSDLRVGNDPCVWLTYWSDRSPKKIVLSMLKTITPIYPASCCECPRPYNNSIAGLCDSKTTPRPTTCDPTTRNNVAAEIATVWRHLNGEIRLWRPLLCWVVVHRSKFPSRSKGEQCLVAMNKISWGGIWTHALK